MTNQPKILIVEDEAEIRSMLGIFLGAEDFEVVEAENGKAAVRQIIGSTPDLIVLDLGLPEMDGQDVIRAVRQFTNTPIVVLTARSDDAEVVTALNSGADDYVTKPFRADVLLARIKANLRQRKLDDEPESLVNGPIFIDLARHEIQVDGALVTFTPKEFALMAFFVRNKGKMLTHKQILREVWGPAHLDDTQYLRVYIGQTREKLDRAADLGKCIVSESGIGYRMDALPLDNTAPTATAKDEIGK